MTICEPREQIKTYLDFDPNNGLFYSNLFFDKDCLVAKIPIANKEGPLTNNLKRRVYSEVFDLTKYTYLLSLTE